MESVKKCVFCNENARFTSRDYDFAKNVDCPNCGTYEFEDNTIDEEYEKDKHLISGLIREKNDLGLVLEMITKENISSLLSDSLVPKTLLQKLEKLLLSYYRTTESYGDYFTDDLSIYSKGYAKKPEELMSMIQSLIDIGYLDGIIDADPSFHGYITFEGIMRSEELLSFRPNSNKVFVAMGFKADLLEAHREAIILACKECGYVARLISEKEHNDDITDRIIAEIKTSKFVITDFTYNNQGAYFEAGYAQGRGLHVIRTCKKEWFEEKDENGILKNHLHFDINHYNFILWENHDDLKEKLINRIRATIL